MKSKLLLIILSLSFSCAALADSSEPIAILTCSNDEAQKVILLATGEGDEFSYAIEYRDNSKNLVTLVRGDLFRWLDSTGYHLEFTNHSDESHINIISMWPSNQEGKNVSFLNINLPDVGFQFGPAVDMICVL